MSVAGLIRILILVSAVAGPIALILFVVLSQRKERFGPDEQVPSYNEIKVDNMRLRRQNQELRERLGEFDS